MTAKQSIFVFPDTPVLVHCKPVGDLDWRHLLSAETVQIVIAPIISRELNKLKDTGRTRRIKQRAAQSIKLLEEAADSISPFEVRPGVFIRFAVREYNDFDKYHLDSSWADDRLLLSAIHYKEEEQEENVVLLATDVGLKLKARANSIDVIKPPDSWMLKEETDPLEQEVKELRQQLNTRPKLSVDFQKNTNFIEVNLPEPPPSDDSFINQCLEKLKKRYPLPDLTTHSDTDQVAAYTEELQKFYEQYQKFVKNWLEYEQLASRSIQIDLMVCNTGTSPATDVRITAAFPKNSEVTPNSLFKPAPPAPPPRLHEWLNQSTESRWKVDEKACPSTSVSHAAFSQIERQTVFYQIPRLQHHERAGLGRIWVNFPDYREINGFSIDSQILSDEIPHPVTKTLNVKVQLGGSEAAIWRIPLLT